MESQLQALFKSLSAYGAIYWDQKRDNFLFCDNGERNSSKAMVVDLEGVQFPATHHSWQLDFNQQGARSLMSDSRDIRHPDPEKWLVGFGRREHNDPTYMTLPMNPENTEASRYRGLDGGKERRNQKCASGLNSAGRRRKNGYTCLGQN
ncbi:uncharacterized protein N7515_007458 [Penicillium bovifimosum]|uniref:Uncharacterized protein n=1 Tax=Penicillium bovifimosum TaxID=126998 RepID=A0A9W9L1Q2_9EURO|nr:uncharacterized protein N7515_007458 [Penicillium bovifimosum]KAJ5131419.1 hypothetical protein N7515_007458 [Penicillium bovifimosum]